jgi:hypothetical protein
LRRPLSLFAFCVLGYLSLNGCGSSFSTQAASTTTPVATTSAAQFAPFSHVFLVVMENMSYSDVVGSPNMPYLNSLIPRGGLASNYFANAHSSIGNYFMMTTGQLVTIDDGFSGTVSSDNLVRELAGSGKSWKAYIEDLPSAGYTGGDVYPYVRHHNPFAYLTDVIGTAQAGNLVPYSSFAADLASGSLPDFVYLLPNMQDDMHDCPPGMSSCALADKQRFGDAWLAAKIAPVLASSAFNNNGLLLLTFDESEVTDIANGGGHVMLLVLSPRAKPGFQSSTLFQHQSLLRLILEGLGAHALPGAAGSAPPLNEFLQ